jgi:hypothetical protein
MRLFPNVVRLALAMYHAAALPRLMLDGFYTTKTQSGPPPPWFRMARIFPERATRASRRQSADAGLTRTAPPLPPSNPSVSQAYL